MKYIFLFTLIIAGPWDLQQNFVGGGKCASTECELDLLSIRFDKGYRLTEESKMVLKNNASKIKEHPSCYVKIVSFGTKNKAEIQMSLNRADVVMSYLIEELGIPNTQIYSIYGQEGDPHIVELIGTLEKP